jgi:hypothetical protein
MRDIKRSRRGTEEDKDEGHKKVKVKMREIKRLRRGTEEGQDEGHKTVKKNNKRSAKIGT